MPPEESFRIRPLSVPRDVDVLHRWFSTERARYWGMQTHTPAQIAETYRAILASGHACAWIGGRDDATPLFLFEAYQPALEEIGEHYRVRPGDLGMHCFVGPPPADPVRGFSRLVFRSVVHFLFSQRGARRIVVEPDVNNQKVHALNLSTGFEYQGEISLRAKRAALAWCCRDTFYALHDQLVPPTRKDSAA